MYGSKDSKSRQTKNCKIGSKVTTILTTFFVHELGTSILWIMGESEGDGLWLLAIVTGGR